jgi:hypothetical protein
VIEGSTISWYIRIPELGDILLWEILKIKENKIQSWRGENLW